MSTQQTKASEDVTTRTLADYAASAEGFREDTIGHDVSQNIDALLDHIEGTPPFTILDLGCGPGRDLKTFTERGHHAIGLDGLPRFCEMARAHSGCEVWQQNFMALDLPAAHFDGIFANATLFHVPTAALPRVLGELRAALKPGGVLFSCVPRGDNEEGWMRERYKVLHDLASWQRHLSGAGFVELLHYYRPSGVPFAQQKWLASVWRKPAV